MAARASPETHETDHCDGDAGPECCRSQPFVFRGRRDCERSKTGDEADEKGESDQEEQLDGRHGEVRAPRKRQELGRVVGGRRRSGCGGEDDPHQLCGHRG
jgi:hypothetical protein